MRRREDIDTPHSQRRLSEKMQRSWESGDYWLVYAICIALRLLRSTGIKSTGDFFGPTEADGPSEAWKERLSLLVEG